MEINFDQFPSVENIRPPKVPKKSVYREMQAARRALATRKAMCEPIRPIYKRSRLNPRKRLVKLVCVCPQYRAMHCCRHVNNVIIDRDLLTQQEHICYLAGPKRNFGTRRSRPRFYYKRSRASGCTARIDQLAHPHFQRVQETLENFHHVLSKRKVNSLKRYLMPKAPVKVKKLKTAMVYIREERRLINAQKRMNGARCKRMKRLIRKNKKKQIKRLICFLFEGMKDHLTDDQFMADEKSTLYAVLLEQIRNFSDNSYYTSSNLRSCQQILANNLALMIKRFITSFNIQVALDHKRKEPPQPEPFLNVSDYVSLSNYLSDAGRTSGREDTPFPDEFNDCEEQATYDLP